MRFLITVFVTAVLVGVFALLYIYSGAYNVAATSPQGGTARWLLGTVMQKSVEVRARSIEPKPLDDKAMIARGAKFYGRNCESCHGGPGVVLSDLGRGLRPGAPDLARAVRDWKPRELFWIVKNGVRMTGMPAWGPSHKDDELWAVVAFISKLPTLSADDYRAYVGHGGGGPAVSEATGAGRTPDRAARDESVEREAAQKADRPTGAAAETDATDGAATRSTPEGAARDVANAGTAARKPEPDSTSAQKAKPGAVAEKPAPEGAARDTAKAQTSEAAAKPEKADNKTNARPAAPAKQTAQAAPRIRVHARPEQKPEPPRSFQRR